MENTPAEPTNNEEALVLFDGVCNLCSSTVDFILSHERDSFVVFATLQSKAGKDIHEMYGLPADDLSSILLFENGELYSRSSAILQIARHLNNPWRAAYWLLWIPQLLRDAVYTIVAANRYSLFGKRDTCRMPDPALMDRFLD